MPDLGVVVEHLRMEGRGIELGEADIVRQGRLLHVVIDGEEVCRSTHGRGHHLIEPAERCAERAALAAKGLNFRHGVFVYIDILDPQFSMSRRR